MSEHTCLTTLFTKVLKRYIRIGVTAVSMYPSQRVQIAIYGSIMNKLSSCAITCASVDENKAAKINIMKKGNHSTV